MTTTHDLPHLSPRERQTLEMIAKGLSNPQIAENLDLSVETVRIYVKGVLRRLQAANRVEATVIFIEARGPKKRKAK